MRTRSPRGWRRIVAAAALAGVAATGCGLPDNGATRVDAEDVPYRLLEPGGRSTQAPDPSGSGQPSGTLVFWVDADGGLVPVEAAQSCDEPPGAQVSDLLDLLSAGPTDAVRSEGWSSAWVPPADLSLSVVDDSTAVISVDATTRTPADLLPLAIGQVALSVATASGVTEVLFTDVDGEPLAVPLPGGAFTEGPVGASDYSRLVDGTSPDDGGVPWEGCP